METNDKKRIAVTAGILAVVLLLAVCMLLFSGRDKNPQEAHTDAAGESLSSSGSEESVTGSSKERNRTSNGAERAATKSGTEEEEEETPVETQDQEASEVKSVEGYTFFEPANVTMRESYEGVPFDTETELETMFGYWDEGNLAAVRDLAALPRYEAMSDLLKDSGDFFYYGSRDASGIPDGKGIAVYADNQYYYGDFKDGVRSGKGEWLQRYPAYMNDVVIEHYYTGEWADDAPNGAGQDHYEYDENKMEDEILYLLNAIGTFKDGVYHGDMYVMFEEPDGSYTEWKGNCIDGMWSLTGDIDPDGNLPILHHYEDRDHHIWVTPSKNKDFHVEHLIIP